MKSKVTLIVLAAAMILPAAGCQEKYTPLVSWTQDSEWDTPYGKGMRLETRHYALYTTIENRTLRSEAPAFLEAAYQNYLELTGLPDRPIGKPWPVYLLNNREQWAHLTRHTFGKEADIYLQITAGGYTHRGIGVYWRLDGAGVGTVAAHEGLHQFFYYRLRHHLPAWLEEGLCTIAEGYHHKIGGYVRFTPEVNNQRFNALRNTAVKNDWIPLEKLLQMDASDAMTGEEGSVLSYYAQVWALARYLRQHREYSKGLYQLLADAEAGTFHTVLDVPMEAFNELHLRGKAYNVTISMPLFKKYFTEDLEAFEKDFREYAERKLAGIVWPPREPSLFERLVPGGNAL